MASQTESIENIPREGHDLSLWTAVLGAPVLWLCHLQLSYMLVPWCCSSGKRWVLHVVSAVLLALTLGGGGLAWREYRQVGTEGPAGTTDPLLGRSRLLALVGILSSGLFALAIVAQAIPSFILDPCVE